MQVHTNNQFLTSEQREKVISNLEECISFFEQKPGMLTVGELRVKSMLSVLRDEIVLKHADTASRDPFHAGKA